MPGAPERGSAAVEASLDGSTHARLPEVRALRALVLSVDEAISEHVRWNAPSVVVDAAHPEEQHDALVDLVRRWVRA